jgi:hypothetical protein
MRLRHAGPYSLQCYACQVRVDRQGSMSEKRLARWERYEQMVEYIETLPRGAEVWRPILARKVFGGGPTNWTVAGQVVRDMAAHGLLQPVTHREGGNTRYYRKVY